MFIRYPHLFRVKEDKHDNAESEKNMLSTRRCHFVINLILRH